MDDAGINVKHFQPDDYNYTPKFSHPAYDAGADTSTYFKKGGRVTGIAKRGFGRALMKGKK